MKTKHILYLYFSLLLGYCTTEYFDFNIAVTYTIATLFYWVAICAVDYFCLKAGKPLLSTQKRERVGKREVGGDIVRTIAIILVPVVHFFGQTFYYNTEFNSDMILPTAIRWLGICAVPLFLIISGYFKGNAVIGKKHYMSIIPLICTHIFISSIRIYVDYHFHGEAVDWTYIADKLLFFEYGWYIRLYICMLLIMPFFNLAYKALDTKAKKEIFILTLLGLNALGPLTFDVVPASWLILYVFGYYIAGCYIAEYKVKLNAFLGVLALVLILAFVSTSTALHCKGQIFDWDFIGYKNNSGYSSMAAVFISLIIMVLCMNIDFDKKPVNTFFKYISVVSLEMYLFSQMFDGFIYKDIIANNVPFLDSFRHIVPLAGSSILLAFIASHIKRFIFMIPKLIYRLSSGNEPKHGR